MLKSHEKNEEQKHHLNIGNKYFENVAKMKYL